MYPPWGCSPGLCDTSFEVLVTHYGSVDLARDQKIAEAAEDLPWDAEYAAQDKLPMALRLRGKR